MTGLNFPYTLSTLTVPRLGLIALQSDETIEGDMRRLLPSEVDFMVSRVPSGVEVSSDTLASMEEHLSAAAGLFPHGVHFDAIGYGCTSGTAQIGVNTVAARIRDNVGADTVTQPLTSLVAACQHLGVTKLALLSPYVTQVSERLRSALAEQGVETPVFGSFNVSTEAIVVRINGASIKAAAEKLMKNAEVDALFLSCTNLRTLDVIEPLEQKLGKPVLTSNQVLAWHLITSAGGTAPAGNPGLLFRA